MRGSWGSYLRALRNNVGLVSSLPEGADVPIAGKLLGMARPPGCPKVDFYCGA